MTQFTVTMFLPQSAVTLNQSNFFKPMQAETSLVDALTCLGAKSALQGLFYSLLTDMHLSIPRDPVKV